jgi:hypothetical protein
MKRRAQQAIVRYHDQIHSARITVALVESPQKYFADIVMEDGTMFKDWLIAGSAMTCDFVVSGSVEPGPCACSTTDLQNAILKSDLSLVQDMIEAGVDVNSQSYGGPMLLWAATTANTFVGGKRAGHASGVLSWLACRPDIRWYDLYTKANGSVTAMVLDVLRFKARITQLLPWHLIDTHSSIGHGDNMLCSYLIETNHDAMFMMANVELLLAHGSGTLALSVNDDGLCACDMIRSDLAVGIKLRQSGKEAAEAVRVLLLRCIGVNVLVALVFGYYTSFL